MRDESVSWNIPPDGAARLLEAVLQMEVATTEMPHIVIHSTVHGTAATYSGPFESALEAFAAAEEQAALFGDDASAYSVAPLIYPSFSGGERPRGV